MNFKPEEDKNIAPVQKETVVQKKEVIKDNIDLEEKLRPFNATFDEKISAIKLELKEFMESQSRIEKAP